MEYKKLEPITKEEVENIFSTSSNEFEISETWFRMINSINNIGFIEKYTIFLIQNNIIEKTRIIDGILGYVIIHRKIPDVFTKIMKNYCSDDEIGLLAEETLNHIKLLIKNK